MKKILVLLTIVILMTSCEPEPVGTKHIDGKSYILDIPNCKITITEYTIDGCQYLGKIQGDSRACYLTHKGNCNNPIHNKSNEQ